MANKTPPAVHIEWAKYLSFMIPGDKIRVTECLDRAERNSIAIFSSENAEGVVAATIGVMDHEQSRRGGLSVATEIILDARKPPCSIQNVAATIGLYMVKNRWKAATGIIFADIIDMYVKNLKVKHIVFVPPFQWDHGMTVVRLTGKTIYPLLAVPITENERNLLEDNDIEYLQERWEMSSTDVLDWRRDGID